MKRVIKKWAIRLITTVTLAMGLLLGIVLNPTLLYAHRTVVDNYTIYHNSDIDDDLVQRLEHVTSFLERSEIYDPTFRLDICLKDGSYYPTLLEKIRGQAFAWGFSDKVVLQGRAIHRDNYVERNGYHWNLEQLITHEAVHCHQYNNFGFWNSNPIAKYPNWKWEGYPEYVSRQDQEHQNLLQNIDRFIKHQGQNKNGWAIEFSDGTISPIDYYKDWLLVKYSLDIKQLSYELLLIDSTEKEVVEKEMMNWYHEMKKVNAQQNL